MKEISVRMQKILEIAGLTNKKTVAALERKSKELKAASGQAAGSPDMSAKAAAIATSGESLRKYLKGETIPSLPFLEAFAEICGVRLTWLVSGEGAPTPTGESRRLSGPSGFQVPKIIRERLTKWLGIIANGAQATQSSERTPFM